MTTSVEDIIRAIQVRPEVREQVRRAILTDELLELPQKFVELTRRFDELAQRFDELTATVQDMARVQSDHASLLGTLVGDRLERRSATIVPPRVTQMLGLRRPRVMYHPNLMPGTETEFLSSVEDAADTGRITDDEEDRIKQTDLIIRSRRKSDGSEVWFAVEASGTIGERDISRASATAAALRTVFEQDTIAVVVGFRIRAEDRTRAEIDGAIVPIERESGN